MAERLPLLADDQHWLRLPFSVAAQPHS